jgi:hypothetical protein
VSTHVAQPLRPLNGDAQSKGAENGKSGAWRGVFLFGFLAGRM